MRGSRAELKPPLWTPRLFSAQPPWRGWPVTLNTRRGSVYPPQHRHGTEDGRPLPSCWSDLRRENRKETTNARNLQRHLRTRPLQRTRLGTRTALSWRQRRGERYGKTAPRTRPAWPRTAALRRRGGPCSRALGSGGRFTATAGCRGLDSSRFPDPGAFSPPTRGRPVLGEGALSPAWGARAHPAAVSTSSRAVSKKVA